jgi:hypothetical protein
MCFKFLGADNQLDGQHPSSGQLAYLISRQLQLAQRRNPLAFLKPGKEKHVDGSENSECSEILEA